MKGTKELHSRILNLKAIGDAEVFRQGNIVQFLIRPRVAYILDEMKILPES